MTNEFQQTYLFRRTLGTTRSPAREQIERLKNSFLAVRRRVAPLLTLIPRDVPHITIHDITHIDALWSVSDLILGDRYPLNPIEGYVLGVAFLLHDAGMTLAAYPGGLAEVKKSQEWSDALKLHEGRGRVPTQRADHDILSEVLRRRHAQQAQYLATMAWPSKEGGERPLIEDEELREFYGPIIGPISNSHNWSVDRLAMDLPPKHGAMAGFPSSWTLDPLKLACILRVADAAHINAERAPHFHRIVSRPFGISDDHWNFQSRLFQPYADPDDTLIFRSRPFKRIDIPAWWLAYDALKMLDREIRASNDLLSDTNTPLTSRPLFKVRRVRGVDSPERLAELLPTDGWWPIDTSVHISNPSSFVYSFGGAQLYGDRPWVALRELLQNAVDAVEARRFIDPNWPLDAGKIVVEAIETENGWLLTIADNGVGMSRHVLTGSLIDFGKSLWHSREVQSEYPGLLSTSFSPIGKFGIGFFSVFMISQNVTVHSRRFDSANAWTLDFLRGLDLPAILERRQTLPADLSTVIEIKIAKLRLLSIAVGSNPATTIGDTGMLKAFLCQAIAFIAPATSVSIYITEPAGRCIIPRGFWQYAPEHLYELLLNCDRDEYWHSLQAVFSDPNVSRRLQHDGRSKRYSIIKANTSDDPVGRASFYESKWPWAGYHIIQGFRGERVSFVRGLIPGDTTVASRLTTRASLTRTQIDSLISDQIELWESTRGREVANHVAQTLAAMDFNVMELPIILTNCGILTGRQFMSIIQSRKEHFVLDWQTSPPSEGTTSDYLRKFDQSKGLFCFMSDLWWGLIEIARVSGEDERLCHQKVVERIGRNSLAAQFIQFFDLEVSGIFTVTKEYYFTPENIYVAETEVNIADFYTDKSQFVERLKLSEYTTYTYVYHFKITGDPVGSDAVDGQSRT